MFTFTAYTVKKKTLSVNCNLNPGVVVKEVSLNPLWINAVLIVVDIQEDFFYTCST